MLVAGLALALLVACNGDDGSSDSSPDSTELTRAEFTAQADAICESDRGRLSGFDPPRGLGATAAVLREVLPVIRDQINRLRELGEPPSDGAQVYLDWFQARDAIVEATAQMIEAAEQGDRDQFQRLAILQKELDERADEAAEEYGFEVCGTGGT